MPSVRNLSRLQRRLRKAAARLLAKGPSPFVAPLYIPKKTQKAWVSSRPHRAIVSVNGAKIETVRPPGGERLKRKRLRSNKGRIVVYDKYIKSLAWWRRKERFLKKVGRRCSKCGSANDIQVHHRTYDNLGSERDEDLQALCKACHEEHHGRKFEDR